MVIIDFFKSLFAVVGLQHQANRYPMTISPPANSDKFMLLLEFELIYIIMLSDKCNELKSTICHT